MAEVLVVIFTVLEFDTDVTVTLLLTSILVALSGITILITAWPFVTVAVPPVAVEAVIVDAKFEAAIGVIELVTVNVRCVGLNVVMAPGLTVLP